MNSCASNAALEVRSAGAAALVLRRGPCTARRSGLIGFLLSPTAGVDAADPALARPAGKRVHRSVRAAYRDAASSVCCPDTARQRSTAHPSLGHPGRLAKAMMCTVGSEATDVVASALRSMSAPPCTVRAVSKPSVLPDSSGGLPDMVHASIFTIGFTIGSSV
jgi:hypothetical protein